MSQEELAAAVGVARPAISQIESGARKVTTEELISFSRALNASLEQILGTTPLSKVSIVGENRAPYRAKAEGLRISVPQKNLTKFKQALLYILNRVGAKPNIGETVLYKLLYFMDFNFYEKYEEQLIGATYIRNHHGPTPVEFRKLVERMIAEGEIEQVKSSYFNFPQTKYLPRKSPDLSALSAREIGVIDQVLNRLSDMNAAQISEYSHKDVPWLAAEEGMVIEYESVFYRTPEYSARDYGANVQ
jgi:transcriptional regulator with XRE-family HTH domain